MTKSEYNVVWLSGLSGAGKSTLAFALAGSLRECGFRVHVLDGDELRKGICSDLGFSARDRAENIRRVVHIAKLLVESGVIVVVALITPLEEMRQLIRSSLAGVLNVFVDAPLSVCEERDPKGLYKKARAGEIAEFTGVSASFELPIAPDVICQTARETPDVCVTRIVDKIVGVSGRHQIITTERGRTLAVDFDGVIADYDGWRGRQSLGNPRTDVLATLRQLRSEGWKIILCTTRGADEVKSYLIDVGVPFDEININSEYSTGGQKPVATVYWDDRALRYSGDAMMDIANIRSFRTWNGRT